MRAVPGRVLFSKVRISTACRSLFFETFTRATTKAILRQGVIGCFSAWGTSFLVVGRGGCSFYGSLLVMRIFFHTACPDLLHPWYGGLNQGRSHRRPSRGVGRNNTTVPVASAFIVVYVVSAFTSVSVVPAFISVQSLLGAGLERSLSGRVLVFALACFFLTLQWF